MKKVIAMVLALATMLSMTAFAADDFYDITADTGITVTKMDDALGLDVTVTDPVDDAYYGVLLVEGKDVLPTEDSDILYINQETAGDSGVAFEVLPLTPAVGDVTLYVSSNATGATLLKANMMYGTEVVTPTYALGDVNMDGTIAGADALKTAQIVAKLITPTESENSLADVTKNGSVEGADALKIAQYVAKLITEF